jgi:D-alanyl-D-alanine dipeptidase/carboxypeptidase
MNTITLSNDMINTGDLILVNQENPYVEDLQKINLVPVPAIKYDISLEYSPASVYISIMDKLSAWNSITAISGWRSKEEQKQIYKDSIMENGADFTTKYVANPGHSEHQTGLAIDVALNQVEIDYIAPDFPYIGICNSFRDIARCYGFIERYPKGKEEITGIAHEPWHFRYVGPVHSAIMEEMGDTLEEYHLRLKQFSYNREHFTYNFAGKPVEIFYLKAKEGDTKFTIESDTRYMVSGNNIDGFIITIWKKI